MKALADSVALLCEHAAKLECSFNSHTAQSRATRDRDDARVPHHAPTSCEERKPLGKAPVYDGSGNIKDFFHFFKRWCASGNPSDEDSLTALCSAIRGEARDHLGNSRVLANGGTYAEVKYDLLATFGCQEMENLSKLTAFKRSVHMLLEDYIASFHKLCSQAAVADERDDLQVWLFL